MIFYPTLLPTPLLKSGKSTSEKNYTVTKFDYRNRLNSIPKHFKGLVPSFEFDATELDTFLIFVDSVSKSNNFIFYSDWAYEGNFNYRKAFRLTNVPTVNSLGAFRYNVSINVDIVYSGMVTPTPIISDNLIISNYLIIGE